MTESEREEGGRALYRLLGWPSILDQFSCFNLGWVEGTKSSIMELTLLNDVLCTAVMHHHPPAPQRTEFPALVFWIPSVLYWPRLNY